MEIMEIKWRRKRWKKIQGKTTSVEDIFKVMWKCSAVESLWNHDNYPSRLLFIEGSKPEPDIMCN